MKSGYKIHWTDNTLQKIKINYSIVTLRIIMPL